MDIPITELLTTEREQTEGSTPEKPPAIINEALKEGIRALDEGQTLKSVILKLQQAHAAAQPDPRLQLRDQLAQALDKGGDLDAIQGAITTADSATNNLHRLEGDDAWNTIMRRKSGDERAIPTPWPSINRFLELWPGAHILVGGTGSGKTQWAVQLGHHAAHEGIPVGYIGLELGEVGILSRLVALEYEREHGSRMFWSQVARGAKMGFSDEDSEKNWDLLGKARQRLKKLPIYTEYGPPVGWPASKLEKAAHRFRAKHPNGPGLIILDFLQLIGPEPMSNTDLRQRITNATYAGRRCGRDYGLTILLISSTARVNYNLSKVWDDAKAFLVEGWADESARRAEKEESIGRFKNPGALVGLGKESGDIEYSADSVSVVIPFKCNDGQERHIFATSKVRSGVPGWSALRFNGQHFTEDKEGTDKVVEPPKPKSQETQSNNDTEHKDNIPTDFKG